MDTWIREVVTKKVTLAVGLMSGTSLDGIDAALVQITGKGKDVQAQLLHFQTLAYTSEERARLLQLCSPDTSNVALICETNHWLGKKFAEATLNLLQTVGRSPEDIDFISSHGQTIYHMPEKGATLQIGELAEIAERTGILTVGDFRPSDIAAGGEGAPLVPFIDNLLFRHHSKGRILLNIGGIGNMTVLPPSHQEDDIIAFDTGPGNVLIDGFVQRATKGQQTYDQDGQLAGQGRVDHDWLQDLLDRDEYLQAAPPKSTGRERYNQTWIEARWKEGEHRGLSIPDRVATATQYTIESISQALQFDTVKRVNIEELLVGGGGAQNPRIMAGLQEALDVDVHKMDDVTPITSEAKEAVAFALLGYAFLNGEANTIPTATGATKEVSMGKLVIPSRYLLNQGSV
ncbi:anhydro-N-acetylmuramic acid kinase [Caldalkalibacillus salinus]|uniref:anhydro-N-acetylmuramic acid kinase n=1 Tax=Caldalkalibacillus salinus TaxID=2803787 RepID=UPI0019249E33|nr:anhydro-N-acetylmuramic acid kinase [Caldalkalibacillus salinus]